MSLMWTLRRWIDPSQRAEEEDRKRKLEAPLPDQPGGDGDPPPLDRPPRKHTRFRCRTCGLESEDAEFCMQCLAATMEPVRG